MASRQTFGLEFPPRSVTTSYCDCLSTMKSAGVQSEKSLSPPQVPTDVSTSIHTRPPLHGMASEEQLLKSNPLGLAVLNAPTGPPPGPPPGPPGGWLSQRMSKTREICFIIMVTFLQIIPQSTLTTVFPITQTIAKSFHITNASILPWLVAAYSLSFGTFILISGRIGDIFNPKRMVVIGFVSMAVWSAVAAISHYSSVEMFFVARGFQGLSASFMVPNGLALLGRTYPPNSKKKIFAFTLFGLFAPVGAYVGMLVGALFAQYLQWWWTFYTYAGLNLALAIAAQIILLTPAKAPPQIKPFKAKLGDFDWLGAMTGVSGMMCIQVALVSAPSFGWKTQFIYMLLIIGVLLITFFSITEIYIAKHPLVPFKQLKTDVALTLAAVGFGWATFGVWTWYLWKYMLTFWKWTPLKSAIHAVPIVPVAMIASVITAILMKTTRPAWILFWALLAFMLGPLLLAINPFTDMYWGFVFASLFVMPFGMDLSFPASTLVISNFFPPQQQGVAGSLISTVVYYSISLGLGLASTVEVNNNNDGQDLLKGIRSGWFMGVGLGGLGMIVCVIFICKTYITKPSSSPLLPQQSEKVVSPDLPQKSPVPGSPSLPQQAPAFGARRDTTFSSAATIIANSQTTSPNPPQTPLSHSPRYKAYSPRQHDDFSVHDSSSSRPSFGDAYHSPDEIGIGI